MSNPGDERVLSETHHAYSPRGERIATTPALGPATAYAWDGAGRLAGVARGETTAAYGYWGDGLRAQATVGGETGASCGTADRGAVSSSPWSSVWILHMMSRV